MSEEAKKNVRYRVQYGNYWPIEILGTYDTEEQAQEAIDATGNPMWEMAVVHE